MLLFFVLALQQLSPKTCNMFAGIPHIPITSDRQNSSGKANSSGWIRRAIWKNLLESHIERCHSRAWRVYHPWRAHHRSSSLKWKLAGGFLKWWYPQIIHFNWVFHYKPIGVPLFLETPSWWLNHPSEKYDHQIGNLPQGRRLKSIWNHHLWKGYVFGFVVTFRCNSLQTIYYYINYIYIYYIATN